MKYENKFFEGAAAARDVSAEAGRAEDRSHVRPIDQGRVRAEVLSARPERLDATRVISSDEVHKISQAAQAAALKDREEKQSREVTRVMQQPTETGEQPEVILDINTTHETNIAAEDVRPEDVRVDPLVGTVLEFERPAPAPTGDAEKDHLAKIKHIDEKTLEILKKDWAKASLLQRLNSFSLHVKQPG
jgi:hypothetical protein